ncbi:MAG: archaeal heat shock protein Hsp20 [archaeon]
MSWDEEFPAWFSRRRRSSFFGESFFDEMNRMMEDMFKDFTQMQPKELVRERRLPDGSTVREMGPFMYGYSMTMGPDGKPVIREFGNVKPSMKPTAFGVSKPSLELKQEREPLVDTILEKENVKVVAELPGVERDNIELNSTENSLIISVNTENRKYYKELELPSDVDPDNSKATYKNGVLEIVFPRTKERKKGREIKIE